MSEPTLMEKQLELIDRIGKGRMWQLVWKGCLGLGVVALVLDMACLVRGSGSVSNNIAWALANLAQLGWILESIRRGKLDLDAEHKELRDLLTPKHPTTIL